MLGDNQEVSKDEMAMIRRLGDFDLKMLISEIHDNGWLSARALLPLMLWKEDKQDE